MKKTNTLLMLLSIALVFAGCSACPSCGPDELRHHLQVSDVEVYRYDGCEYLSHRLNSEFAVMTHKGDCDNPIHVCPEPVVAEPIQALPTCAAAPQTYFLP